MPSPHPLPPPGQSLQLPLQAAFYYPWFPQAWNQQGLNPFTHYHPSLGFYSCDDAAVLAAQITAMLYGGQQAAIASWWGQGSHEDARVAPLLQQAGQVPGASGPGRFRICLYYEAEGNAVPGSAGSPNPTSAQIDSDLNYILTHYASHPNYLHLAGKPVIFAYGDPSDSSGGQAMCNRWAGASHRSAFYTVLKVFPGYQTASNQPDGWHQYAPSAAFTRHAGAATEVSPGFWKASETQPRLGRAPTRFAENVANMALYRDPLQLLTTFNEWGEGSSVESAQEWASHSGYGQYLEILNAILGPM